LHLELSPGAFDTYNNEINQRISALVIQSPDTNDRIGGIHAITHLIDFKGDDPAKKITRYANYLRAVSRGNDTTAMIYAARALGRLIKPGGTITAELVEAEVKYALEYLQTERQENRRFAAVLNIRELARNSPTLMYQWVPQIFDVIWSALRDPKVLIRESAAEAVSALLEVISPRDSQFRQTWFTRVYDEVRQGFALNTNESIHGSLLTLKELLLKGAMFMTGARFKEACDTVLRYKDHRDPLIRREVVVMIPILAGYSPQEFVHNYLHQSMLHLQGLIKRDKDRNNAFIAVGQVANAVGSSISPYLDGILLYIREGLQLKA
jgi:serine/threonine-protein kinase mTOR